MRKEIFETNGRSYGKSYLMNQIKNNIKDGVCVMNINKNGLDLHGDIKIKDMVNHPDHYKTKNGLETIDVIEAFTDGLNGIEASDTANIIKYACRWKKKNGIEDLKKIRWYVNHLIKHLNPNDIEFKEPENHFKCPSCGGDIVRDLIEIRTNDISALINVPGEPTCDSCGRTYVININEDLSYEIINS